MTQPISLPRTSADWPEWFTARTAAELAAATTLIDELRAGAITDPVAALHQWDLAHGHLGNVGALGSLMSNVHPEASVRELAEAAEQTAERISTEWSLNQTLYAIFASISESDVSGDPRAARMLHKVQRDFRRSGVDRDEATRAHITDIQQRLTELGQEFSRVIREDVRSIRVTPAELDGMPQDWLDAHPIDADGLITATTDYPDSVPVRTFARSQATRRAMTVAFLERGWPTTEPLLVELFTLRHELATTVGYADWASYDAEVKMIGAGPAIPAFIDQIAEAATAPMERDREQLLARYRQDFADATEVPGYDFHYYAELVRAEQYEVDSQLVRTYFDFAKVRDGLLVVTGRLFGVRYEQVNVATWHADVTVYDVIGDVGARLGRIYLDLHPRDDKFKHAAQFTLTDGVAGLQSAEGVLVCNFSRGLMEHDDVVTLFHEFGHLLHHVFAGHGEWFRFAGVATEWDFVEAPSQMLEEWAWHADVLRTFASDASGDPIPVELVEAMRRAEDYGKGILARTQMFYAAQSYWFHADRARPSAEVPALTDRMIELQARYSALPYLDGTHMFASFGHLGDYSSGYYTYMWSLVIAKDLWSAFDHSDVFAPAVAARYRDRVLARGGEAAAAELVTDFLGRPFAFDSYAEWLSR